MTAGYNRNGGEHAQPFVNRGGEGEGGGALNGATDISFLARELAQQDVLLPTVLSLLLSAI